MPPIEAPPTVSQPHFSWSKVSWGKIFTGLGLCCCLIPFFNVSQMWESLKQLSLGYFLLSLAFFMLASAPAALVWCGVARRLGASLSFAQAWRLSLVGFFWNNLIPGGVAGDAVRVWEVHKYNLTYAKGAASVFIERWSALAALVITSWLAWFMADPIFTLIEQHENISLLPHIPAGFSVKWSMLAVIALMLAAFLLGSVMLFSQHLWQDLRLRLLSRFSLGSSLEEFTQACALIKHNLGGFAVAIFINLLAPLLEATAVYIIFYKICPQNLPFIYFLIFIPIFRIMLHLPVSANGIGTQEAAFALYWGSVGMSLEPVLASSILIHAVKLIMCVLGALLYYQKPHEIGISLPIDKKLKEV